MPLSLQTWFVEPQWINIGQTNSKKQAKIISCFCLYFSLPWQCFRALCCKGPPPPRPEYDLVCIGLTGSGKTSLLSQLCSESPENIVSTTGRMLSLFHDVLVCCPKINFETCSSSSRELELSCLWFWKYLMACFEAPTTYSSMVWPCTGEYPWKHTFWTVLEVWHTDVEPLEMCSSAVL